LFSGRLKNEKKDFRFIYNFMPMCSRFLVLPEESR
jgi:hypothetical protein